MTTKELLEPDFLGNSVLIVAAIERNLDMVKWLLANGVVSIINQKSKQVMSALMYTINNIDFNISEELLKAGASIYSTNTDGKSSIDLVKEYLDGNHRCTLSVTYMYLTKIMITNYTDVAHLTLTSKSATEKLGGN